MGKINFLLFILLFLLLTLSGCNLPGEIEQVADATSTSESDPPVPLATNTDSAKTIYVAGGTFLMGSTSADLLAEGDEMPVHEVTLDGFRIYTHEVTNQMYSECVDAGTCRAVDVLDGGPTENFSDPAFANHPVVGVDWIMAQTYCNWAGGRLPTEAEWELASRSTGNFLYPWGNDDPSCEHVNMLGCHVPPNTLAVGSLAGGNSPYALWDMSGNVWEWAHDWYGESYYTVSPGSNPLGPSSGNKKIVRGGGLYSEPNQMRSAARQAANPHRAYDDVGFRCVAMNALTLPDDFVPVGDWHLHTPPGDPDGGGERVEESIDEYSLDVGCNAEGAPRIYIQFPPGLPDLRAYDVVEVRGPPLDCRDIEDGHACWFWDMTPGEERTFGFLLMGGGPEREIVTVIIPECTSTSSDWNLTDVGCHSEDRLYLLVDTYLEAAVPGSGHRWNMNIDEFGCEVIPGYPGRFYCSFPIAESRASLQFCVTPPGEDAESTCVRFVDFETRIPATCEQEFPEDEALTCSDYSDKDSCQANGCEWTKGPPDGLEHCYDP